MSGSGKFKPPMAVGVIDLGAHSLRLEIFQVKENGSYKQIESLTQPVAIGREVFSKGVISAQSMNTICAIMGDYTDKIREYGVSYVRAFGTSAVREALNRDILIDRVATECGIQLTIMEPAEEAREAYLAIKSKLGDRYDLNGEVIYVSLGTGSTWMAYSYGGKLVESEVFGFGTLRIYEEIGDLELALPRVAGIMEAFAQSLARISGFSRQNGRRRRPLFIGIGASGRLLARIAGKQDGDEQANVIKFDDLDVALDRLVGKSIEALAAEYNVVDYMVRSLAPACLLFRQLCQMTGIKEVVVPTVSTREAVIEEVIRTGFKVEDPFVPDIISTALALGEKYRNDTVHAQAVADNCMKIFDLLKQRHTLDSRKRVLLYVAALLHDIGGFVDSRKHHKHSLYLIQNSQLPGLSDREMKIIALAARYHRKAEPKPEHLEYSSMPQDDRVTVCKLAAILRVADALDRAHQNKFKNARFKIDGNTLTVKCGAYLDLTVERIVLKNKVNLFRNIFGMKVALE